MGKILFAILPLLFSAQAVLAQVSQPPVTTPDPPVTAPPSDEWPNVCLKHLHGCQIIDAAGFAVDDFKLVPACRYIPTPKEEGEGYVRNFRIDRDFEKAQAKIGLNLISNDPAVDPLDPNNLSIVVRVQTTQPDGTVTNATGRYPFTAKEFSLKFDLYTLSCD